MDIINNIRNHIANVLPLCSLIILAIMLSEGILCSSLRIQCNERDQFLLLNFKHIVVDPSSILSTWSDERDCCEWEGVQCDNTTGRVIKLSLPCPGQDPFVFDCGEKRSQCLTGQLHLSLLKLEFLNYLDLSFNDFHAIVKNDYVYNTYCRNLSVAEHHYLCENSSNLHYVDLSYNENLHMDSLDWLYHFPSLTHVNFTHINLDGRVDWIQLPALLPSIKDLSLENCQLTNINPFLQLVNLTSLEVINLSKNYFSSQVLPVWLFNLSEVTTIDLSETFLQGEFPKGLLNNREIKELYLNANKFTGQIPDWLGQFEQLQALDVSDNFFSGPIPSTLGNISSLIILDFSSNYLNESPPESLGQLLNLEELCLYDNHFTGYVSQRNFVRLSNLNKLTLGSPSLIFDFDSLWIPPFQLEEIHLSHMVGSRLLAWIYTQSSLSRLKISDSIISFKPQDKFWDFVARVTYIRLEGNTIHGEMSNVLLNSTIIMLGSNKMKGKLPQLSPNVISFSVENNSLQGSISSLLCQKMNGRSQLRYLDMSSNLLSGGLTNCWMHWKSLVYVMLDDNNLTGTIPPSISLLANLVVLHLNQNNLFGEIPLSLINCKKLQILDVGENNLNGSLTNRMLPNAKILRLRSNQLSGNIPPQICQLASLIILDLAENKISGSLPNCLQNLTAMTSLDSSKNGVYSFCIRTPGEVDEFFNSVMVHIKGQGSSYGDNLRYLHAIDLSNNNISGAIPPEIFSLTGLQSLNLSHNKLEGTIPNEISNMKILESLDLSSNQFLGEIPQSMANLSFLETLNLSFNNFIGKIPSGTQLQGFDALSYIGNPLLCGTPLQKNCTNKENAEPIEGNGSQEDKFLTSFYIGMGVGFAMSFWGVCAAIFFNRNFRHAYFRFLYHLRDKLYVMAVLKMNQFR